MAPGLDVAAIPHFCEQRVPPHALDQFRLEAQLSRGTVTTVERRAPWREDYGLEWTSQGRKPFGGGKCRKSRKEGATTTIRAVGQSS